MFKRKSIFIFVLIFTLLIPTTLSLANVDSPKSSNSQIIHQSFYSEELQRDYSYNIYLPTGYKTSDKEYPVLYLLHGSYGNEYDWVRNGDVKKTADKMMSEGEIPESIIVMPGSNSWWVDGHNENADSAFMNDLIPHIDDTWRTIDDREGRLVSGLSAGGYGTVNFVLKYPDMFAAGAALSPAVYVPTPPSHSSGRTHPTYQKDGKFDPEKWEELNFTQYIDDYKQQDLKVPLYINSGDHDTFDIAYHAAVLYQNLREHQPELVEFRVVDGDHNWDVWRETLPEAMEYMYRFVEVNETD
ncbi:alpha/beta hydrolase [Salinibacillus xinjiangensis]|uniref:Prolyl oligopeptidase family serine peptidase n=1 Tax=Salinibacillus xinjiangensis TaxID=1229268 RepID=A0A6G1X784_9BACI|nr:alpha/beta hydrolase-fold protein [Salinibacillus xinjiangensis]MRG86789.1 prolyl oligopeptidase family serine peptidase [Salinibacillus xinjiangensis]